MCGVFFLIKLIPLFKKKKERKKQLQVIIVLSLIVKREIKIIAKQ